MQIRKQESLAPHTTLRIGGPADTFIIAESENDILDAFQTYQDAEILILGGGSNLVIGERDLPGVVLHIQSQGIKVEEDACSGAMVSVQAGVNWDEFVTIAISNEWYGIEALSGIPGLVGATPVQNVGAYGQDVSQTIARVKTFDRYEKKIRTFSASECNFGYRTSRFKQEPERYVVLEVTFQLGLGVHSAPVHYSELAHTLGVELGKRSKSVDVRNAVLDLRTQKGMVLNEQDHDTWSVGSFFTNPVVTKEVADSLPATIKRWEQDTAVKISAASLLEHSGFEKGYGLNERARVSSKHALAITNRGDASAEDIVELARSMHSAVLAKFSISLEIEPRLLGVSL
ncbi:MAG: UDP-N-acetylmuramate dehydrogenase [Candidatus Nanopelagicales bacterium]